jgi:hypothetical protein
MVFQFNFSDRFSSVILLKSILDSTTSIFYFWMEIMTLEQQKKIAKLIEKYNDILLNSMRLAVAEDFINLIVLNRDDSDFELKDFLGDKEQYYQFILKEFLRLNSSSVASELRKMEDQELTGFIKRRTSTRNKKPPKKN